MTHPLQLEEKLLEAALLEAIGRLAGGLAHDFNNLLTVIRGSATLAKLEAEPESALASRLTAIERSAIKAGELIQQLLAFGRKQLLKPCRVDLHQTLAQVEPLLRKLVAEDVELCFEVENEPAWVFLDQAQLEQVLLSLAVHARDSMPAGGRLIFNVVSEQSPLSETGRSEASPTHHMLSVRDTGLGLSEEDRAHIFEPFFRRSGGTGLSLAMVYGVVRQSGGVIEVDSLPGQGTCFRLYFPRVEAASKPVDEVSGREDAEPRFPSSRRPVVLVVEDQAEVRRLLRDLLSQRQFEVHEAASGVDALALAGQLEGRLDLLLTDVVMPGISGREVARRLEILWPGLPVLYISGYTDEALGQKGVLESGVELLAKPFTPEQLLSSVERMLTQVTRPTRARPGRRRSARDVA